MTKENFLSFSILMGFLVGAFFAIIKFQTIPDILLFTTLITISIVIIFQIGIAIYIKYMSTEGYHNLSDSNDEALELFRRRLNALQKISNETSKSINDLDIQRVLEQKT